MKFGSGSILLSIQYIFGNIANEKNVGQALFLIPKTCHGEAGVPWNQINSTFTKSGADHLAIGVDMITQQMETTSFVRSTFLKIFLGIILSLFDRLIYCLFNSIPSFTCTVFSPFSSGNIADP